MAKVKIPNAIQMQALKYGDASDADRDAVVEALRTAGRRSEALMLFEHRTDHPGVAQEADWAVSEGNGFHLIAVHRLSGKVTEEQFRACAAKAERTGHWQDARHCYVAIGDHEALGRLAEDLPPSLAQASREAAEAGAVPEA
jgi:hypothetical protein